MKQSPGSLLLLLALFLHTLYAEEFDYHIKVSNDTPFVKEPIILSVELNQTDPTNVLLFQFEVKKANNYEIRQIGARHDDTLHHTRHLNRYEIYPLKAGDLNLTFSLTKRVTNDAKVKYFASGDRDDFKKLDTKDFTVPIPPMQLHVKPLPEETQIVGDFTLNYQSKKKSAQAYEPIPVTIVLEGRGYPPSLPSLLPKSEHYTLFGEAPRVERTKNAQGTHLKITYLYALSSDKDIVIPPVTLKAFNPFSAKPYALQIPSQHFKVSPVEQEVLLDHSDTPPPLGSGFEWLWKTVGYLIAFLSGFVTAKFLRLKPKHQNIHLNPLQEKIRNSSNARELLQVLLAQNDPRYKEAITALEAHLYKGGSLSLAKLKHSLKEMHR